MNKINATVGVRVDMMIKIGHGKWNHFNAHASPVSEISCL